MNASNQRHQEVLLELLHKPVAVEVVQKKGIDLSSFISGLASEGAVVVQERGFLHWKSDSGFGQQTLSARLPRTVYFTEVCSSTNDWARDVIREKDIKTWK